MIRLANILIFIITFGLIGFICYDLYSIKPIINSDELAILRGNFDKKGRLITKRKFNKIYNKVTIDSLEALKLSNSIIEALDFQANLLSNSTTKKYKIGSLKIDKNQLIATSNSLKKMILNKTIQCIKDSFQFYQLKGFDKKGNYNLGLTDQSVFPELSFEDTQVIHGLQITFVIQPGSTANSRALLEKFGMPFEKGDRR